MLTGLLTRLQPSYTPIYLSLSLSLTFSPFSQTFIHTHTQTSIKLSHRHILIYSSFKTWYTHIHLSIYLIHTYLKYLLDLNASPSFLNSLSDRAIPSISTTVSSSESSLTRRTTWLNLAAD